jgi:large subunit ribosomal protein L17
MRHRKKGRKLNRTTSHKKSLLRNLANQLFEHKEIRTTTAKAKEARPTVERLITYAKKGDHHHRRLAFNYLRQKSTIKVLFDEIAPTYTERPGGYTRVIKLGRRQGDGAAMSILQLVGFETIAETVKTEKKKKSKKKEQQAVDKEKMTSKVEDVEVEEIEPKDEKKSAAEIEEQATEVSPDKPVEEAPELKSEKRDGPKS